MVVPPYAGQPRPRIIQKRLSLFRRSHRLADTGTPDSDHATPTFRDTFSDGFHSAEQVRNPERLRDVVVGADFRGVRHALLVVMGGEHDDGQRLGYRIAADRLQRLVPVHLRHHEVAEDEIRAPLPEALEADAAVIGRQHLEAFELEDVDDLLAQAVIVFDQEDPLHG